MLKIAGRALSASKPMDPPVTSSSGGEHNNITDTVSVSITIIIIALTLICVCDEKAVDQKLPEFVVS